LEEHKIKQILEAAILAADGPLDRDGLLMLLDEDDKPDKQTLERLLNELAEDYAERGVELREVGSGFRFQVRTELGPWVSRLWAERAPRYSRAIMETLALIAYRQPVTRGEIEEVRGVSVGTQIIRTLQERGWVRVVGHRDVPGRPAMFATTKQFLDYFNLASLDELPALSEIKDLDKLNEELELEDDEKEQEEAAAEATADAGASAPETGDGEQSETGEEPSPAESVLPGGWQEDDPDIDESQLMKLSEVDAVLKDVEETFHKKPHGKGPEQPATEAQSEDEEAATDADSAETEPPDPGSDADATEADPDHE
jgi:segregation and condensation protein B